MFLEDPQLNANEAKVILREIANSIKKTSFLNNNNNILFLISLPHYHNNQSLTYCTKKLRKGEDGKHLLSNLGKKLSHASFDACHYKAAIC